MLLSTSSQYAITGISRLAALPIEGFCRVDDLVRGTLAPRHAVARVFHQLSKRRILQSVRGIGGGYRPGPGMRDLTLIEIVEAVDGPYDPAALTDRGLCPEGSICPLAHILQPVSDRLDQILRKTRIRNVVAMFPPGRCCAASDPAVTSSSPIESTNRSATGEGAST